MHGNKTHFNDRFSRIIRDRVYIYIYGKLNCLLSDKSFETLRCTNTESMMMMEVVQKDYNGDTNVRALGGKREAARS